MHVGCQLKDIKDGVLWLSLVNVSDPLIANSENDLPVSDCFWLSVILGECLWVFLTYIRLYIWWRFHLLSLYGFFFPHLQTHCRLFILQGCHELAYLASDADLVILEGMLCPSLGILTSNICQYTIESSISSSLVSLWSQSYEIYYAEHSFWI